MMFVVVLPEDCQSFICSFLNIIISHKSHQLWTCKSWVVLETEGTYKQSNHIIILRNSLVISFTLAQLVLPLLREFGEGAICGKGTTEIIV